MNFAKLTIIRIPFWFWIAICALIIFLNYDIPITADMNEYMNHALNIFLGKGYTNIDGSLMLSRGPLFPLMIAASYWLCGVSPLSAFWIVRVFAVLNVVIIYIVGKKFYGQWVGVFASFLVLTSYSVCYWSYRHIDAIWPFFCLCFFLMLYEAYEKEKGWYFVFSGIFIGLAYLVKESSLLLFPLPILIILFVRDYRNKQKVRGLLVYILTVLLTASPWFLYVYWHTFDLKYSVFGIGARTAVNHMHPSGIFTLIRNYCNGILAYYRGHSQSLSNNFFLAPIFVCAWLYVFYKALKKDKVSIIFTLTVILLSPFLAYIGLRNFRVGQALLFILLSYLITAHLIMDVGTFVLSFIGKQFKNKYFGSNYY